MKKIAFLTGMIASVAVSACGDKGIGQAAANLIQAAVPAAQAAPQSQSANAQKKWDGPFGLAMGLTPEQIKASGTSLTAIPQIPGLMKSSGAPSPNSSFNEYLYLFGSGTDSGLCKVVASTPTISANPFGDQIKDTFHELSKALTEKYGKPETLQFVKRGSLWTDPNDWMMGLSKEERHHASYWTLAKLGNLPNSISSIGLSAKAESPNKGYVSLSYEFSNFEACQEARKKSKNSSL